jgi:hypothetical protein
MTSKEFVIWLRGFTEGVHEFNITPKQWDYLKEKLSKVSDEPTIGTPIGPGWGVPNSAPFVTLPHITPGPLTDPYNPYKITCRGEETPTGTTITTTPGTGFITIANPNLVSFSSGSTSTTYGYPSGSAWHYTNNTPYTTGPDKKKEKIKKK